MSTEPLAADPPEDRGARPTAILPIAQLLRIAMFWLGLTAIDAAVGQFIQFRLNYSDIKGDLGLGLATTIVTAGAVIVAVAVQPTVGAISDYAVTRWGRRKPFIVFGAALDAVFLLGIAYSNTLVAITAFVILLTFSTNIARGPFQGYVPDLVAAPQVGMASGLVGMMQIAGNITGYVLANVAAAMNNLPLALVAVAVVEVVTMISVVLRVGNGLPPKPRGGRSWFAIAREAWGRDILQERSYVWLLASRLFFLTAGAIVFAYAVGFLKFAFGLGQEDAAGVNLALAGAVAVGNLVAIIPASRLSDRIGRKPVIYLACAVGAVGTGVIAWAPAVPIAILGAALYGAASGIFIAVDWALMTDIIPRASAGRYMGLSNVATGSSALVASVIGGLILDSTRGALGDATAIRVAFAASVVIFIGAAILLRPVVEPGRPSSASVSSPRLDPGTP
jgi:MFS family permease